MPKYDSVTDERVVPFRQRPSKEDVQRAQVLAMAAVGAEKKDMAHFLRISVAELVAGYRQELKYGFSEIKNRMEIKVIEKAVHGDSRCLLAWLKQYGGWTEITRKEITGANGEPISFRSLDGPSLDTVVKALREASSPQRRNGGAGAERIVIEPDGVRDLDTIPGTANESTEQQS